MRCYLIKIMLFLVTYYSINVIEAQTNRNRISISLMENKDKSNENNMITAIIHLKNISNTTIEGNLDVESSTEDLYILQSKPKKINLHPGEEIYIPIKALISKNTSSENATSIVANFIFSDSNNTITSQLPIIIEKKRLIKMILQQTNLLYEQIGDSLRIPIRILNEGNTTQTITILINYPEFVSKNRIENSTITIKANTDSLIIFKKEITKEIIQHEEFLIAIRSLYKDGDIIGVANVRANPIKQNRRFLPEFIADYSNPFNPFNQITASHQSNNNHQNVTALYANAQTKIKDGTLYTNLDFNWWEQSKQIFMRNTWIGYKEKKFGLQLGNVTKFEDLNLIGRGIETFYKTTTNNTIETGFLEKSFSIIDFSTPNIGQSAWISLSTEKGSDKGSKTTILFDNDSKEAIQKGIISTRFSIMQKNNFSLQLGSAVSAQHSTINSKQKLGSATEINFYGKSRNLLYTSNNYFSSSYFAGIRSGALNLNESINLNLEKINLWLNTNHFSFAPKSIENTIYYPNEFSNTQLSTGVSKRFTSFFVSLALTSILEKRTEQPFGTTILQEFKMNSNRITIGSNYFKNNQNINLSIEGGLFTTSWNSKQQIQFKANLNYSWRFFNLTSYYQYNNFYLSEIIASQQKSEKTFFNYIIAPNIQINLWHKKLHCRTGLMYSKNNLISNTLQLNNRIDFDWNKNYNFFITNFYSDYSNSFKPLNTIQFGLTKRFNPIQIDATKNNLELYLFYDITDNEMLELKNKPAGNQLVLINNKAFKTNEQGIIKYTNIPSGYYEIRPMNSNEWHAPSQKIKIEKSTKIAIALSKTTTAKGSVRYLLNENSFPINPKISGLLITLTDEFGAIYHTKTDETGKFIFYVPKNKYVVTLDKSSLSEYVTIESNSIHIQTTPEMIIETNFDLQVKEKRIETKKFGNKQYK